MNVEFWWQSCSRPYRTVRIHICGSAKDLNIMHIVAGDITYIHTVVMLAVTLVTLAHWLSSVILFWIPAAGIRF